MSAERLFGSDEAVARTKAQLSQHGAEILAPTNPYEVARFRTLYGVGVVYRNGKGQLNPNKEALDAMAALAQGGRLTPGKVHRRKSSTRRRRQLAVVLQRDGHECFYCGEPLAPDPAPLNEQTVLEHLISVTHGGPDHIANKYAAHRRCELQAGHMSAPEKIALRDRLRAEALNARAAA